MELHHVRFGRGDVSSGCAKHLGPARVHAASWESRCWSNRGRSR
jgi:hypothetical protein